jgi:hypothetical protein
MSLFEAGSTIRFTYNSVSSGDRFKEVLVLHPNWNGKVHAIDLKRLTAAEREVLNAVLDPKQKGKTHKLPLVNDILTRMDPTELIRSPTSFYNQLVKQFLNNKDAYRTYTPSKMTGIQKIHASRVTTSPSGRKPLFGS